MMDVTDISTIETDDLVDRYCAVRSQAGAERRALLAELEHRCRLLRATAQPEIRRSGWIYGLDRWGDLVRSRARTQGHIVRLRDGTGDKTAQRHRDEREPRVYRVVLDQPDHDDVGHLVAVTGPRNCPAFIP